MTSALRWGWVVSTTPRPLSPRERPGTHCNSIKKLCSFPHTAICMDLLNFHYLSNRSAFVIDTDCFLQGRNGIFICNIRILPWDLEERNQKSDSQYPLITVSLGAATANVTWRHYDLGIVCYVLVPRLQPCTGHDSVLGHRAGKIKKIRRRS